MWILTDLGIGWPKRSPFEAVDILQRPRDTQLLGGDQ
jgi:hypothetical protein